MIHSIWRKIYYIYCMNLQMILKKTYKTSVVSHRRIGQAWNHEHEHLCDEDQIFFFDLFAFGRQVRMSVCDQDFSVTFRQSHAHVFSSFHDITTAALSQKHFQILEMKILILRLIAEKHNLSFTLGVKTGSSNFCGVANKRTQNDALWQKVFTTFSN